MTDFALHTADTTPEASKPLLAKSQAAFGMIPNLHAVMAEAPGLLEGYQQLHQHFLDSSFDAAEKTVVWQTVMWSTIATIACQPTLQSCMG